MDNSVYVGLSRQITLQRALDVTANNLANMDTAGFKVESLMTQTDALSAPTVPGSQPIKYVIDNGVARNYGQGALEPSSNPMDVAIEGDGFFAVQTPNGVRYTRDGRLSIDTQNQLVDHQGNPVLSAGGSPIQVDPQQSEISIGKDGTITQAGKQGSVSQVGKLGVSTFTNMAALQKEGDNLYDAGGAAPTVSTTARMHQGMVERANVQPITEITKLISITRAYERVSNMVSQTEDLSESAVQRLGKAA